MDDPIQNPQNVNPKKSTNLFESLKSNKKIKQLITAVYLPASRTNP